MSNRQALVTQRLQSLVGSDRAIVAWARGWVSREVPVHALFAARTLDFVVLTESHFLLVSTGFFTRRPRRLVYEANLDRVLVAERRVPRGRRLLLKSGKGQTLRIELADNARANHFADELIASAVGRVR
jgi:hypothetical protein